MTEQNRKETLSSAGYNFGFDEIMGAPNYDRFPAWYAERRLPPSKPFERLVETPEPVSAPPRKAA